MAMKIRCSNCRKRISVDDAFAGGVCRCPYCTELVFVAGESRNSGPGGRPEAPGGRPEAPGERPEAPGVAPPAAVPSEEEAIAAAKQDLESVPMAAPVRLQGIVTIILIALVLMMMAAGVYLLVQIMNPSGGYEAPPPPPEELNPFKVAAEPAVAGIKIDSPVLYVLDAGLTMREVFNYAVGMTRISVRGLTGGRKFNIILCREGEESDESWYEVLLDDYETGGMDGDELVQETLEAVDRVGATDVSLAMRAALAMKPRMIVLFARKPLDDVEQIGRQARQQGVRIVTISLDADEEVKQSLGRLAEITGGQSRAYSYGQMREWSQAAPPLD